MKKRKTLLCSELEFYLKIRDFVQKDVTLWPLEEYMFTETFLLCVNLQSDIKALPHLKF